MQQCQECERIKSKAEFTTGEWQHAGYLSTRRGKCIDCSKETKRLKPVQYAKQLFRKKHVSLRGCGK
eukprot:4087359-Karenia_brevis.AAC.1